MATDINGRPQIKDLRRKSAGKLHRDFTLLLGRHVDTAQTATGSRPSIRRMQAPTGQLRDWCAIRENLRPFGYEI